MLAHDQAGPTLPQKKLKGELIMLPQDFMSANAVHTFARLLIDGLAICYFNRINPQEKAFWEVAFLRYDDHDLKIKVSVVEKDSKDDDEEYEHEYIVSSEVETIDLLIDNGTDRHYDTFREGYVRTTAKFSRTCGDEFDFRWVVNFVGRDIPHGELSGLKVRADSGVKLTIARIPHSLFYTHRVTEDFVILAPKGESDLRNGFIYGPTNQLIGAMIYAEKPGTGKIVLGNNARSNRCQVAPRKNKNCVINLPPLNEGLRYKIKMDNMDKEKRSRKEFDAESSSDLATPLQPIPDRLKIKNYTEGDFCRYYDVINTMGEKLTLWAPKRQLNKANKVGDCHAIRLETGEINTLAELVEESRSEIKQEEIQSEQQ